MDIFSRDVPPTHPGVILAEALENMNLKIMPAASLRGDAPITPPMALKIGTLCGNGPNLWINMQTNHDLWHEARRMRREIKGIEKAVVAR